MKAKYNILAIISLFCMLLSSCGEKKTTGLDPEKLPQDVKPVAVAILSDSPSEFAKMISYPVERPYPLRNIEDSMQMVKYYHTLVDDSLKNKIRETPDTAWFQDGWRGWTLADGSYLWVDSGSIYAIDYVSKRENKMLDSLRNEEMSTLEPSLRGRWIPVMCITDTVDGAIFRIDSDSTDNEESGRFRLAGYSKGTDLSGTPAILLYGIMESEGSMNNRFYHFKDSIGNKAEYSPDNCDNDSAQSIEITRNGKPKRYRVKRDYWLDHVKAFKALQNSSSAHIIE